MSPSSDSFTGARSWVLLGSMAFTVFLIVTVVAAFGPLLVDLSLSLGTSVPVAGQLVSTAAGTWAVTALLAGPFSDAYGRKPVIVLGVCLLALGSLGISQAPGFAAAAASCVFIGMGGGMVPPTCVSLIGDVFPNARKPVAISVMTMQPGVSSVVGVPLAAVIGDAAGWRMPFLLLGVALFVAALVLYVIVPYDRAHRTSLNLGARLLQVARFPLTWYMAATNILSRSTWGVLVTFFPAFLIVTFELNTLEVALPVAVVALGTTAAPLLGGRIAKHRARLRIIAAMLLVATVPALALFLWTLNTWTSVVVAGLFMLLSVPANTMILILIAETGGTARGTLSGVISCSNWGGAAAGAAVGGLLVAQVGFGALSYLICGAILCSGLLMMFRINDAALGRARTHYAAPEATER